MLQLNTDKKLPPISVLQETGWQLDLTVSGQSMEPLIQAGDTVTVTCTKTENLKEGDVICFKNDDAFVLHRLVEVRASDQKCFYEKGDAETRGQWISGSAVLGVLKAINGTPVDAETASRITTFSRHEKNTSELLAKMKLSPPSSWLSSGWRKLKTVCRRVFMGEGR